MSLAMTPSASTAYTIVPSFKRITVIQLSQNERKLFADGFSRSSLLLLVCLLSLLIWKDTVSV